MFFIANHSWNLSVPLCLCVSVVQFFWFQFDDAVRVTLLEL